MKYKRPKADTMVIFCGYCRYDRTRSGIGMKTIENECGQSFQIEEDYHGAWKVYAKQSEKNANNHCLDYKRKWWRLS